MFGQEQKALERRPEWGRMERHFSRAIELPSLEANRQWQREPCLGFTPQRLVVPDLLHVMSPRGNLMKSSAFSPEKHREGPKCVQGLLTAPLVSPFLVPVRSSFARVFQGVKDAGW